MNIVGRSSEEREQDDLTTFHTLNRLTIFISFLAALRSSSIACLIPGLLRVIYDELDWKKLGSF
ncbi:MAG: hypothetical protein IGR93_02945 [Hydrococcus sp. C42_A2020_068]|uniref:hypothetical protein n=1 Tax=Pleurocapsa sp. PCC 7327 TaxID=118163 RepID=UPI00029FE458|nr:hypothetical protein [Pleurocapsa sp. PCC 7327]AFY77678.1 hypothetical protein Ple7327_2372 [Pleurocapsa sp. PCC 7327]MBF2019085.1 hypothetical protein [Hydrococcus sp. C42_A2020_068]